MSNLMQKILGLCAACILSVSLIGCGGRDTSAAIQDNDPDIEQPAADQTPPADDDTIQDKPETVEGSSDPDLLTPIAFTYENQHYKFVADETELASGNEYHLELGPGEADKYPELKKRLDGFNKDSKKEILDFFTGSEEELQEMIKSGWLLPYELYHDLYPKRADGRAFSFGRLDYIYLAGAHGVASFSAYNIDPVTGEDIPFSDVVKETEDLPQIIADELQKQNPDLTDYFEECPGDLENLIADIPNRLANDAHDLTWALDYDGITVYFEDYAMGAYAVGAQTVKISFKDHPQVFTDTYDNYLDNALPDIMACAKELPETDISPISASEGFDASIKPHYDEPFGDPVTVDSDTRRKMNLFLTNFSEAGLFGYDSEDTDLEQIIYWAYLWNKINKWNVFEYEQRPDGDVVSPYEKLSYDALNKATERYMGYTIPKDQLAEAFAVPDDYHMLFWENGYMYSPAADGESYTLLTVLSSVEDLGENRFKISYNNYSQDLDAYFEGKDKAAYYGLTGDEAASDPELEQVDAGYAVVEYDGSGYKLNHLELY